MIITYDNCVVRIDNEEKVRILLKWFKQNNKAVVCLDNMGKEIGKVYQENGKWAWYLNTAGGANRPQKVGANSND